MLSLRCARDRAEALPTSCRAGLEPTGTARRVLSAALLAAAAACGPSIPTSTTMSSGEAAGAAVITAIAAGTLWLAGGGCRLQGCPYGSYCNKETGYCDVRKCKDGCPEGTICNEGLGRCQAPPPPKVPNDFLPQDDARNPPGNN
jgi:hypothetical protein